MKAVGAVCEFNPIHGGHIALLENIKKRFGDDPVSVCVMSGSFVQRGEPAVFDKYSRAEAAVRCGFDLVLELPAPWSFAPAELFARGAVEVLDGLGCVGSMMFGSECGDIGPIEGYASGAAALGEIKTDGRTSYQKAARVRYAERFGPDAFYPVRPNDILACEYAAALKKTGSGITPETYARSGGPSASRARRMLAEGCRDFLPEASREAFAGAYSPVPGRYDAAVLHSLGVLARDGGAGRIFGLESGAGERLASFLDSSDSAESLIKSSVCGRYSAARLRRGLLCAALGVTARDYEGGPRRVQLLASGRKGRELLSEIRKSSRIVIAARQSDADGMTARADRLYALICGIAYSDFIKKTPFISDGSGG